MPGTLPGIFFFCLFLENLNEFVSDDLAFFSGSITPFNLFRNLSRASMAWRSTVKLFLNVLITSSAS